MVSIVDALNWRYATKKFDPKKKIKKKDLNELLEALRLSPSSYGLQPWKFLVITNKKLREEIRDKAARGQPQITDASHLIAFCTVDVNEKHIEKYIERIMEVRKASRESLQAYEDRMKTVVLSKPNKEDWARHQMYIALGFLLLACAVKRIDACPMEGFEPDKLDQILNLKDRHLKSVVLCPVGYRGDDDYAKKKKVRFDKKDVFEFIA